VIFDYTPEVTGNHSVYYNFYIPEFKLEQQFMICGRVIEPRVFLSLGKINFGPLLLGGKNKEIVYLKNLEEVPISFSFNKDSVKGEAEYGDSLKVNPMSGLVRPESEITVEV
jgi:hydrocephalus-inducing protein